MVISQNWLGEWFGAARLQAITWASLTRTCVAIPLQRFHCFEKRLACSITTIPRHVLKSPFRTNNRYSNIIITNCCMCCFKHVLIRDWFHLQSQFPFINMDAWMLCLSWLPRDSLTCHYIDVIMTTMASQITSLTVVYSTVYSDAD